jgi:hypothetical protein
LKGLRMSVMSFSASFTRINKTSSLLPVAVLLLLALTSH